MEHKGKIHIIDDEPIIHEVLGDVLTTEGYKVETSLSGEEALETVNKNKYAVVLVDLMLFECYSFTSCKGE